MNASKINSLSDSTIEVVGNAGKELVKESMVSVGVFLSVFDARDSKGKTNPLLSVSENHA